MAEDTAEDLKEETLDDEGEKDGASEDAEEEKEPEDEEDLPVPVRNKLNAQRRIIEKQGKELEKDEEELTPQARALIEAEIDRRVAPLRDELSFRDYFAAHPEDKKYEKSAKARFDAWKDVPIEEVMKTLRPVSEGRKEAEVKAKKGSINGSASRPKEGQGVAKTEAELQKLYNDRKAGKISSKDVLKGLGIQD